MLGELKSCASVLLAFIIKELFFQNLACGHWEPLLFSGISTLEKVLRRLEFSSWRKVSHLGN